MPLIGECFEYIDKRFFGLTVPSGYLETLYDGCRWAEGPVWFADGRFLVWSDIPNNRMLRWTPDGGVGIYRAYSNYANGNTRDRQGRLVTCEHGGRRLSRTEPDGSLTTIADKYKGKKLNSPNDVVVKSDGSIWFTDPDYGIMSDYEGFKAPSEQAGCYVYRVDGKTGAISVVADDFVKPNGLAFSPDEKKLYIADSAVTHDPSWPHHIRVFDVVDGKKLKNSKVLAEIDNAFPDGFRVDVEGNVWTSAGQGVNCYHPSGALLGRVKIPEVVSNLTFGGERRNRLFVTATTSLYTVFVGTTGAQTP